MKTLIAIIFIATFPFSDSPVGDGVHFNHDEKYLIQLSHLKSVITSELHQSDLSNHTDKKYVPLQVRDNELVGNIFFGFFLFFVFLYPVAWLIEKTLVPLLASMSQFPTIQFGSGVRATSYAGASYQKREQGRDEKGRYTQKKMTQPRETFSQREVWERAKKYYQTLYENEATRHQEKSKEDPYQILGINVEQFNLMSDSEFSSLKNGLLKSIHPDKLQSKELPPELVAFATERTQKINEAYSQLLPLKKKSA